MTPVRNVALVGLGAIGILYAGQISARDPRCLRVVADPARLARYRADPPALNGRRLDLNYATPEEFGPPADLVLVAVKSTGLAAALPVIAPLLGPNTQILPLLNGITAQEFRDEMATLTLGSGAAAMVLARAELAPGAPRYKGGVTRAATEWNKLCRGNLDGMITDTRLLLIEGIKLATKTFEATRQALGWVAAELDEFVIHQVSKVHTAAFTKAMGIDPKKVMTIFSEHGNIGPASVPIVLSKLREMGRLKKGDRVALLGIGSGLNCSMAEVVW